MKYIIILSILLINWPVMAQNDFSSFLDSVKHHNATLKAAQQKRDAQIAGTKTGITPEGPEIAYGYFPGNKESIGIKETFSVEQSIEFPLVYKHKKDIARQTATMLNYNFQFIQQEKMTEAALAWCNWVYCSKQQQLLKTRQQEIQSLERSFAIKLEKGTANILEVNKLKLQLADINSQLRMAASDMENALQALLLLNGGNAIAAVQPEYPVLIMPEKDSLRNILVMSSPKMQVLNTNQEIATMAIKQAKAQNWPGFKAGYESETILGESYRGIMAGVQIPLWQNKNQVKKAVLEASAANGVVEALEARLMTEATKQYTKATNLQTALQDYREVIRNSQNKKLVSKALELGEISIIDYFRELAFYYDAEDKLLELEHQYYQELVQLNRYRW